MVMGPPLDHQVRTDDSPLLAMRRIGKRFPGIRALADVSLQVSRGEVLALVGENGAGKSTLMKILGGVLEPDEGEIWLDQQRVRIKSVSVAKQQGIALIHQELLLADNLDVAGNVFLGSEHRRTFPVPSIDRRSMRLAARQVLDRVGLDVAPDTPLRRLSTGQRQLVEIAKALAQESRILILDEPTASLTSEEAQRLLAIVAQLRASGLAIIYISHRIAEVLQIADRIMVLRDGRHVAEMLAEQANHEAIVTHMVGRQLTAWFPERIGACGSPVLTARELRVPGASSSISFQLRQSEILGIAGLVGAGRTEMLRVLFGVDRATGGSMELGDGVYQPRSPSDAICRGIYLVPEDRQRHGLVLPMSVMHNISLPDIINYRPRWWLPRRHERAVAAAEVKRSGIKASHLGQVVATLSGGNQQKTVIAKWHAMRPRVLLLDEPTRGVDVGAKAEIYRQIVELTKAGVAILMVSSDMEEIVGMSDRVIVMRERRLVGELRGDRITEQNIGTLMTGGSLQEKGAQP